MLRHHSDITLCALCAANAAKGRSLPAFDTSRALVAVGFRYIGLREFRCDGCRVQRENPWVAMSAVLMEHVDQTLDTSPDQEPTQEMPRTQIARLAKVCAELSGDDSHVDRAQFIRSLA